MQDLMLALYTRIETAKHDVEEGATAVEYGMLVALIAAVIVLLVKALGVKVGAAFTSVTGAM